MTSDTDYHHQVLQIRQSARARLLEIRQARLQYGRISGGADPDPGEDRSQMRLRRAGRLAALSRQVQRLAAGTVALGEPAAITAAGTPGKPEFLARRRDPDTAPPGEMFGPPWTPPAPALQRVSPEAHFGPHLTDAAQDAGSPRSATADPLTLSACLRVDSAVPPDPCGMGAPIAGAPIADLAEAGAADLLALPGAGPGLIWMLQQCGIATLADLADTDAAVLIPKLGLVGQIVDIQAWQRFARRQVLPRAVAG